MKNLLLIVLCFLIKSTSYSNEWEVTHYNQNDLSTTIDVVDSNNVFLFTTPGADYAKIYFSSDKGKNWDIRGKIDLYDHSFEDFSSPDSLNLFAVNLDGKIYKSSDGGIFFEKIDHEGINSNRKIKMYDESIGVIDGGKYITHDGWKTYKKFKIDSEFFYFYASSQFKNDSILVSIVREYDSSLPLQEQYQRTAMMELNINKLSYELYLIDTVQAIDGLIMVDKSILFACGKKNNLPGGLRTRCNLQKHRWRQILEDSP